MPQYLYQYKGGMYISLFEDILLLEPMIPPCKILHSKNLSSSLIILTTTLLKSIDKTSSFLKFL